MDEILYYAAQLKGSEPSAIDFIFRFDSESMRDLWVIEDTRRVTIFPCLVPALLKVHHNILTFHGIEL